MEVTSTTRLDQDADKSDVDDEYNDEELSSVNSEISESRGPPRTPFLIQTSNLVPAPEQGPKFVFPSLISNR